MPIDKYTREFFKSVLSGISHITGRLDRLVGIADRPREDNEEPISPKNAPTEEEYAAIGKMLFALHIEPAPAQKDQPKQRWYETFDGWKKAFEMVGIGFAIGYALITYLQWHDLQHNFMVDERSWAKYEITWPTLDKNEPSIWTETVTNTGKNPMKSVKLFTHVEVLDSGESFTKFRGLAMPGDISVGSVLFPSQPFTIPVHLYAEPNNPRNFTPKELEDLSSGRAYVVVVGSIVYKDNFGDHWARFCAWKNYAPKSKTSAMDCVNFTNFGDGALPRPEEDPN